MRDVRVQYVLFYNMLGTVLPYASVFFRQEGLSPKHVADAFLIWSAAFVLSPTIVTWAADIHVDPRKLLAAGLVATSITLAALWMTHGVVPLLVVWSAHCLVCLPLLGLLDGISLSLRRRALERGDPVLPFYKARVWGTIGYVVPSFLLFGLLWAGWINIAGVLAAGALFGLIAAAHALLLEDPRPARANRALADPAKPVTPPTLAAARLLLRRPMLVFIVAVFLGQIATMMYGAFYPIYLTEQAGIPAKWVGMVSNIGVTLEILFILGCGRITGWIGVRGTLIVGLLCVAGRMLLIYLSAHPAVAIGTQALHGIQILSLSIVPQIYLDRHAEDGYRHSVQGMFVTAMGGSRITGSLVARVLAPHGNGAIFACAAILAAVAAALATFFLKETQPEPAAKVEESEETATVETVAP